MTISFLDKLSDLYNQRYSPMTERFDLLYFFSDGGARLSPPASSSASVVRDVQGQVLNWVSHLLPPLSTCEAEYQGVLLSLTLAHQYQPRQAYFFLDNLAVVGQITGHFAVRDNKLKPLYQQTQRAITLLGETGCKEIEFFHIPREYNLLADALASDALLLSQESHRKNMPFISSKPGKSSST